MGDEPFVIEAYSRVVESQQETIAVQRELLGMTKELDRVRQQLVESTRLELRAAQVVAALRFALYKLAGVVADLTDERVFAKASIKRAQEERARATALADDALELIEALDQRPGEVEVLDEAPLITVEAVMDDLNGFFDRVRQILDDQDSALDRLESEASPGAAVERLFQQYVDAPMPVAILDADGYFLRVNEPFAISFRYAAEDLVRMRMSEIVKSWTHSDDGHLVLPAYGGIEWYRISRWTVSTCQIAVFHEDWERAVKWMYNDTFLPDKDWLRMWCKEHAFGYEEINACRVVFDLGPVTGYDERWSDYLAPFARRMFCLMSPGKIIVQLDDDTFLFIMDGRSYGLDEFVAGVRPALEQAGEGLPFTLDASECGRGREILYDVDTAGSWAAVTGRERPWLVRVPTFSEPCDETGEDGPLLYQPFAKGSIYGPSHGVRVVGRISLQAFRQALEDLTAWYKDRLLVSVDFVVTKEELRLHDWRAEIAPYSPVARSVRILLDGDPDFEDYVLLRRFGQKAEAGVLSTDERVLERARWLRLSRSGSAVLDAEPVDAQGVREWLASRP